MGGYKREAGLLQLVSATAALTACLHRLGSVAAVDWGDPAGWLAAADAELAVTAALRTVGLVIGYWVLASAAVYGAARRRGYNGRVLRLVTFPPVRRLADRAVVAVLSVTIATGPVNPALAGDEPPPPVVFDINSEGIPVPHIRLAKPVPQPSSPAESPSPLHPERPPLPAMALPVTAPPSVTSATTHVVQPGDNLWGIAKGHLETDGGTSPTPLALDSYWRRLVEANRATLRSGDPNLIYPGELITLPTPETP